MREEILLKTTIEVSHIRRVSRFFHELFPLLARHIKPGMETARVLELCENEMKKHRVTSALLGFEGYPSSVCISVNNIAAHGIIKDYRFREGDVVTIDCAVSQDGWYSDSAWTYIAGEGNESTRRLVKAAWQATLSGIEKARAGNRIGDVGQAVAQKADSLGCYVLREFVGHGIGYKVHEGPSVPHFGTPSTGQPIVPGMVFTVEPILTLAETSLKTLPDGWTVVTEGNMPAAQFEQTVAVFSAHTEILTLAEEYRQNCREEPPF
jgi:methionyl aminopeptidase